MLQICRRTEPNGPEGPAEWENIGPNFDEPDELISYVQEILPDCDDWFEYYVSDTWTDEDGFEDRETISLEEYMAEWEDVDKLLGISES